MRSFALTILFLIAIASAQSLYDNINIETAEAESVPPSPTLVKALDLGLHTVAASFFWINTMPEIIRLTDKNTTFLNKLNLVTAVESQLSFPYAFTVLVLPVIKNYPNRVAKTLEIGERGISDSAPDWRIPFYLAIIYHLELENQGRAAELFDLAAHTKGAPEHIVRFSLNYPTLSKNIRSQTKTIWETVRDSAKDNESRTRAENYLYRLKIVELLESAAKVYKNKFGEFPEKPSQLIDSGIISKIPEDPFGFTFVFRKDGTAQVTTPTN